MKKDVYYTQLLVSVSLHACLDLGHLSAMLAFNESARFALLERDDSMQ